MHMQRLAFLILFLLFQQAALATDIEDTLTGLSQMAPEKCAEQPPDELLGKLMEEKPRPEGIGGCEACVDRFYEAYATQLAKKTDVDHPGAKRIRASLIACFEHCFDYLIRVHHTNGTNHYSNRIEGEIEWIIFRGAQQQYRGSSNFGSEDIMGHAWLDDDSNYTPKLIRQIGVAIGIANTVPTDQFDSDILPILQHSLVDLEQAEKRMKDDEQKSYFRRYLVLFLTRFP